MVDVLLKEDIMCEDMDIEVIEDLNLPTNLKDVENWSKEQIDNANKSCKDRSFYDDFIGQLKQQKLNKTYKEKLIKTLETIRDKTIYIAGKVLKIGKIILNYVIKFVFLAM